jgi:hypothetical protein
MQYPPTPLTAARHCAKVVNPQLLAPPGIVY